MTEFYLPTRDASHTLYLNEYGPKNGRPVLMVHGGSGHTFDEQEMLMLFSPDDRVIFYHQRGVGKSRPLAYTQNNTIETNLEDIEHIRQTLGIEQWHIFSWSFGAIFVSLYALENSDRCLSLSGHGPYHGGLKDWEVTYKKAPEAMKAMLDFYEASNPKEAMRAAYEADKNLNLEVFIDKEYQKTDKQVSREEFRASLSEQDWMQRFAGHIIGLKQEKEIFDYPDDFIALKACANSAFQDIPAAFTFGANDSWSGNNSYFRAIYPNAEIKIIPKLGHDPHQARFLDEAKPFFSNLMEQAEVGVKARTPRRSSQTGGPSDPGQDHLKP